MIATPFNNCKKIIFLKILKNYKPKTNKFYLSSFRLGPRELALSVEPWITDTLPPNNSTNSIASTAQLSQQQSKIMNVVVPNVAHTPAASKKIRRKPENKVKDLFDIDIC